MARAPYLVRVSSQKGGVGKTTVSVNLAAALGTKGYRVLLVDFDFTNPSLGIHLRFEDVTTGIRDVIEGKSTLESAIVKYFPASLSVLPGSVSEGEVIDGTGFTLEQLDHVFLPLQQSNYDFVIFDTAPGIMHENVLKYYTEALMVTTPDMPSLTSVIRLSAVYEKNSLMNNFVVNRMTGEKHEINLEEIENGLQKRSLEMLPEDPEVPISISKQIPLFLENEDAPFSQGISRLAARFAQKLPLH